MTYQEMCEFQTLYEAYLEARKGKRSKPGTAQYEANALICTDKLSYVLNQKTYKPSGFEVFYVYEPKKRLVQAPAFVDKVVLHALTDNVLYDTICTSFIRDICRLGWSSVVMVLILVVLMLACPSKSISLTTSFSTL